MKVKLSNIQGRILYKVWRETYGCGRKEHSMSDSYIAEALGIKRNHLNQEINKLIDKKILISKRGNISGTPSVVSFNEDYTQWEGYTPDKAPLIIALSDKAPSNNFGEMSDESITTPSHDLSASNNSDMPSNNPDKANCGIGKPNKITSEPDKAAKDSMTQYIYDYINNTLYNHIYNELYISLDNNLSNKLYDDLFNKLFEVLYSNLSDSILSDSNLSGKASINPNKNKDLQPETPTTEEEDDNETKYGEHVALSDKEYQAFVNDYTEPILLDCINYLNLQSPEQHNKYKNGSEKNPWSKVLGNLLKKGWNVSQPNNATHTNHTTHDTRNPSNQYKKKRV